MVVASIVFTYCFAEGFTEEIKEEEEKDRVLSEINKVLKEEEGSLKDYVTYTGRLSQLVVVVVVAVVVVVVVVVVCACVISHVRFQVYTGLQRHARGSLARWGTG